MNTETPKFPEHYELFNDSKKTFQSCGLLPSELLKQRDEMLAFLKKIDSDYRTSSDLSAHGYGEELERLIESTEVKP